MYSMVLMAALTTGTATPDFFHHHSCCGCYGCYGCYGCHGCCGCYGCGCYGCGCYGCGCYGCGCCGCGCYGCCGCGCYGCGYGGHYAGGWGAGYACYSPGGCWGCGSPVGPYGAMPGAVVPGNGVPETTPKKDKDKGETTAAPDRARLIVEVPADAKLFIDDKPMKTTSDKRSFSTPALMEGEKYYYEVRVEVMRDGKPVSETKKVTIKAGEVARVDFKKMDSIASVKAR
jgi:uncharacterized protein (TIGR03000 family)